MYLAMEMDNSQLPTQTYQAPIEHLGMYALVDNLYLQTYRWCDISEIEAEIEPLIKKVTFRTARGRYSYEDILNRITDKKQQIWIIRECKTDKLIGLCITENFDYPAAKAIKIMIVAGSRYKVWGQWLQYIIENWAKSIGCDMILAEADRVGWLKKRPKDWRIEEILFSKRL